MEHMQKRRTVLLIFFLSLALSFSLAGAMRALSFGAAITADAAAPGQMDTPSAVIPSADELKLIALTFDDGPRRSTTTRLLDGLAERGVHATFFLIGGQAEKNPELIRRMDTEGHQIGIHTYDHVQLTGLNRADFDAQVGRTRTLLEGILGHNNLILRPPYGIIDNQVKSMAGCPIILWSIDPEDWKDRNAAREVKCIVSEAKNGSIILLHDIYPESVDAALQVVDQLHAKGFLFVTVDELFAAHQIELKAGESYWNAYP